MSAEMEHLIKEFEQFQSKIRRAQEQFAGVEQMQEELTELEAVATSPDGAVRVVAGPGGAVKDIRLSQEALRQQAGAISATIMSTLHQAVAAAARKQAGLVESHMGGLAGGIGEQVLQAQADAFGVSVEDLRNGGSKEQAPQAPPPANEMQFATPVVDDEPEPPRKDPNAEQKPAAQRPQDQQKRAAAGAADDDDDGFGSVFE